MATKNAVTIVGSQKFNLLDSTDAAELEDALELIDYDANAKFLVLTNSRGESYVFHIVTA